MLACYQSNVMNMEHVLVKKYVKLKNSEGFIIMQFRLNPL